MLPVRAPPVLLSPQLLVRAFPRCPLFDTTIGRDTGIGIRFAITATNRIVVHGADAIRVDQAGVKAFCRSGSVLSLATPGQEQETRHKYNAGKEAHDFSGKLGI